MPRYSHTQYSELFRYVFVTVAVLFWYIIWQSGFELILLTFCCIILFIIYSFSSLSIQIDDSYLRVKFGYGVFRKSFLLSDIRWVKSVKNKWYYGWGIRVWFWPYMIIYNVSGFDAVEITLENWKIFRIGTDEVSKLEQALQEKIK